jgi:hypothetical protein
MRHSTHPLEGDDLYEYSNGELRQLNETGPPPGTTIGTCGASIAGGIFGGNNVTAGQHAVSDDGARVFFEAVPGKECSEEAKHLYVRINGGQEDAHTVDIGAYKFLAASRDGSRALLEEAGGAKPGLYLYDAQSGDARLLAASQIAVGAEDVTVSDDLSVVYARNQAGYLYRYDIASEEPLFVTRLFLRLTHVFNTSPDGRYLYFVAATVSGLPAGGQQIETPHADTEGQTSQVFRYDSAEELIQCMSCASSFDPEPKLSALFTEGGHNRFASDNGDYVFFDTPAALVAPDVDGEIAPEGLKLYGSEHTSPNYSLSSDVYEWRRDGVDDCALLQGCLRLITSGGGGFLNILLGTTSSARDVFFATSESLLPSDNDTASDIYDARIGGGFGKAVGVAPCEGDSCSTPFAPPIDATPSSATFRGVGNKGAVVKAKAKPKRKVKRRCKAKGGKRCKTKAKKRVRRTVKHAGVGGRTGR